MYDWKGVEREREKTNLRKIWRRGSVIFLLNHAITLPFDEPITILPKQSERKLPQEREREIGSSHRFRHERVNSPRNQLTLGISTSGQSGLTLTFKSGLGPQN